MRIESALNASREGIDAHGRAIAVLGDNIANSNTVGYKKSRVEFSDLMPGGANSTNSSNIPSTGVGVTIQNVRPIYENGIIEATGRTLDAAIDGNGFFLIGDPANPLYSRAGNFQISREGFLETGSGDQVLGFVDAEGAQLGPIDMIDVDIGGEATTEVSINGNLNSYDLVTEVPNNPEKFSELSQAASFTAPVDVFDSLGAAHDISVYFFKTEPGKWTAQAYIDAKETGGEEGTPKMIGQTTLTFNEDGVIPEGNQANSIINAQATFEGAAASNITINLGEVTQYATGSQVALITRDGKPAGAIEKYEFGTDGSVNAILSTGPSVLVGYLGLGAVQNVDGLDRAGNTLFKATERSGELIAGKAGEFGLGRLVGESLERSTVDISKEFVDLVVIQRGYQANSQVLNATSQLLRETIAMIR